MAARKTARIPESQRLLMPRGSLVCDYTPECVCMRCLMERPDEQEHDERDMTRKTARIPESQRGTVKVQLRLDPHAAEVLERVPAGKRSEYVSDLIVDDADQKEEGA